VAIQYFDLFSALWNADQTKISFLILGLFVVITGYIGHLTRKWSNTYPLSNLLETTSCFIKLKIKNCWFAAETMASLGLIGTIAGFLIMLGPAFDSIIIGDNGSMSDAITDMAMGMSTALTTTLVGMVCSLITKAQIVNLEDGIK